MAKLNVNAGKVLILRYDKDFFGEFEKINFNAGNATFSKQAYDELIKQGMNINTGKLDIIEIVGEPIDVGDTVLDGSVDYNGMHLVGGRIKIEGTNALTGVTGIFANNIIAPEGTRFDFKVDGNVHYYPEGAVMCEGKIKLTEKYVAKLDEGVVLWSLDEVDALDNKAVAALHAKGITIQCGSLLIFESADKQFGNCFKAENNEIIPDGFEYINDDLTLNANNAVIYSDKIYINGDLIINEDVGEAFSAFSEIIVTGEACVPYNIIKLWKEIGTANEVIPYKGLLWMVNGKETITREQLEAANEEGLKYTLFCNGMLDFGADVTSADLDCIVAVSYNGVIRLPDRVIPNFKTKVIAGNGVIEPHRPEEDGDSADNMWWLAGDNNAQNINAGHFVRI